jgi:hypothetical protein
MKYTIGLMIVLIGFCVYCGWLYNKVETIEAQYYQQIEMKNNR